MSANRVFSQRRRGTVGYYLHHLETTDLDLFATRQEAFERRRFVLEDVAASLGARVDVRQRDLVDLYLLERAGHSVERSLSGALAKDGGCTPATVAWLLSEIHIPDDARLPAGVAASELRDWLEDLVRRLRRAAAPRM